jgi:hypothetical protein
MSDIRIWVARQLLKWCGESFFEGDIVKKIGYWILPLLLLTATSCQKTYEYKRILPWHLKLTKNINEEVYRKSGNYMEIFFDENNNPVKGYGYKNHKKWCYLNFDNRGRLTSMDMKKNTPFLDNVKTKYLYTDNLLQKVRFFSNGTLIVEFIFYYRPNNAVLKIENIINNLIDGEIESTNKYFSEYEFYNDYMLENHHDKFNTRRKTYFAKNKNKVIYYDPIFAALYKPYQDKGMQIYKCEHFQGDKLIKVDKYDAFGTLKQEDKPTDSHKIEQ